MNRKIISVIAIIIIAICTANLTQAQNSIQIFGKNVSLDDEIFKQDAPSDYLKLMNIDHLYNIGSANLTPHNMLSIYEALEELIIPSPLSPPQGMPVMISIHSINKNGSISQINANETYSFSVMFLQGNMLQHHYFERLSADKITSNAIFLEITELQVNTGEFSSDINRGLHFAMIGKENLPYSSASYLFRSETLNTVQLEGHENSLINALGLDHCRQSGLKAIGLSEEALYRAFDINYERPVECPRPCGQNANRYCSSGSTYCDDGGWSCFLTKAVTIAEEKFIDLGIGLDFRLVYNFRDKFMASFPRGRDYIGLYYTTTSFVNKKVLEDNIDIVVQSIAIFPDLTRVMKEFLVTREKIRTVIITKDICSMVLNKILSHRGDVDDNHRNNIDNMHAEMKDFLSNNKGTLTSELRRKALDIINLHRDDAILHFKEVCDKIFDETNELLTNETDPPIITQSTKNKSLAIITNYRRFSTNPILQNSLNQLEIDANHFVGMTKSEVLREVKRGMPDNASDIRHCDVSQPFLFSNKREDSNQINTSNTNNETTLKIYSNISSKFATIQFNLAVSEKVTLEIFDLEGRKVSTLFEGITEKNTIHVFEFRSNENGVYFCKLTTSNKILYDKIILIK